jgi:hypothetical protein
MILTIRVYEIPIMIDDKSVEKHGEIMCVPQNRDRHAWDTHIFKIFPEDSQKFKQEKIKLLSS